MPRWAFHRTSSVQGVVFVAMAKKGAKGSDGGLSSREGILEKGAWARVAQAPARQAPWTKNKVWPEDVDSRRNTLPRFSSS